MIPYTSRTMFDDNIFVKMKSKCLIEKPADCHYLQVFLQNRLYIREELYFTYIKHRCFGKFFDTTPILFNRLKIIGQ